MWHFRFILPIRGAMDQEQWSRFSPFGPQGHFIGKKTPPGQMHLAWPRGVGRH